MYISFYADFPPTNVIIASLTSRSVTITWKPLSSSHEVINYYISYTTEARFASGGSMSVKGTKAIITNLEEDTEYIITVYVIIDGKISANYPKATIRTHSDGKFSQSVNHCYVLYTHVQFLVHHQEESQ